MAVKIVSQKDIEPIQMSGRTLQWVVTPETIGAEMLSMALMDCAPGSVVKPLHSHKDIEEALYILQGEGEAWVDGETAFFQAGDVVLFPANSKHQVRNTGDQPLIAAAIFSDVTSPDSYVTYDRDVFAEG